jgi:hypothetical protein
MPCSTVFRISGTRNDAKPPAFNGRAVLCVEMTYPRGGESAGLTCVLLSRQHLPGNVQ